MFFRWLTLSEEVEFTRTTLKLHKDKYVMRVKKYYRHTSQGRKRRRGIDWRRQEHEQELGGRRRRFRRRS